jgi:hypothetical protein
MGGNGKEGPDRVLLPFRHSHGGTGCGSAHKPFLASRASFSNPSSTVSPAHTFDTTSTISRFKVGAGAIREVYKRGQIERAGLAYRVRVQCMISLAVFYKW